MVELAPVSEVILDEAAITRFRQNYRIEFGAAGTDDPLYEAVSAGRKQPGMEHWLPFFHDRLETLFDYLPDASVVLDDQLDAAAPRPLGKHRRPVRHAPRGDGAAEAGSTSVYKPAPPGLLYLDDAAWEAALADRRRAAVAARCRSLRARACWMRAGGSGAISRPNASRKTSACSARWRIMFKASWQDGAGA